MVILPSPPTDSEKVAYVKSGRPFLYAFGAVSLIALLSGTWLFVLSHPTFYAYGVAAVIASFYLIVSFFIGAIGRDMKLATHASITSSLRDYCPSVDVFLPCCGEPLEVLANTYRYVAALDYPKDKLNVYVLDDGHSDAVMAQAEAHGFKYLRRPNKGEHKKAGNLRYAFSRTNGRFILILDADFCPRPDFLRETIPYFFYDSQIAIVQTPQFFSVLPSQTLVEKGAGYIQELFYRLIQVNRDTFGGAICVGTCGVYRRTALEPFGGTALIDYSEDVHTGFNVLSQGWKIKYIPLNLSKGICPDTLAGFFIQQYRWAMGSITLFLNRELFWKTKLTLMQRLCYLSGMLYYITTGLGVFLSPLPAILVLMFNPEAIYWYNALFSVPSFIYTTLYIGVWSKAPFGWYAVKVRNVAYWAHVFALYDKLLGQVAPWVPTGAVKRVKRYDAFRNISFYWNSTVFAVAVGLIAYRANGDVAWYHMTLTALFVVYNYWISMSIFKDSD